MSGNQASEQEAYLLHFSSPHGFLFHLLPFEWLPGFRTVHLALTGFPLVRSSDSCLWIHTWPGGSLGPPKLRGLPFLLSILQTQGRGFGFSDEMDQTSRFSEVATHVVMIGVHLSAKLLTPVAPSCRPAAEAFALEKIHRIWKELLIFVH